MFHTDFETSLKIRFFCAEPGLLPPAEHATPGIHSGALVAPINDRLPDENEQALSYGKAEKQPNESVKLLGGLVPSWSLSQDIDPNVSLSNHAKSSDYHSGAQVAPGFMSPDVTVQALPCGKADEKPNESVKIFWGPQAVLAHEPRH